LYNRITIIHIISFINTTKEPRSTTFECYKEIRIKNLYCNRIHYYKGSQPGCRGTLGYLRVAYFNLLLGGNITRYCLRCIMQSLVGRILSYSIRIEEDYDSRTTNDNDLAKNQKPINNFSFLGFGIQAFNLLDIYCNSDQKLYL
jgi:hypothetical protein